MGEATENLAKIKQQLDVLKTRKQQQYNCDDQAQLLAICDQDPTYQNFVQKSKEAQEAFNKADFIKTTYSDY